VQRGHSQIEDSDRCSPRTWVASSHASGGHRRPARGIKRRGSGDLVERDGGVALPGGEEGAVNSAWALGCRGASAKGAPRMRSSRPASAAKGGWGVARRRAPARTASVVIEGQRILGVRSRTTQQDPGAQRGAMRAPAGASRRSRSDTLAVSSRVRPAEGPARRTKLVKRDAELTWSVRASAGNRELLRDSTPASPSPLCLRASTSRRPSAGPGRGGRA